MLTNRPRLAQLALVAVIIAMALPWARVAVGQSETVLSGYAVDEGRFVVLVAMASIAAIQLEWRPAWIGAGLVVATLLRGYFLMPETGPFVAGDNVSPGAGIWVGVAAGVSALVILVWNMFSEVAANAPPKEVDV